MKREAGNSVYNSHLVVRKSVDQDTKYNITFVSNFCFDFIHCLNVIKTTAFRKLFLIPFSGKRRIKA
jgi:hypothetical protein